MSLISIITDSHARLTKSFTFDPDGKLVKNASGHVTNATIETKNLTAKELSELIPSLSQYSCLCLGQLIDYSKPQPLSCNKLAGNSTATRTKAYLDFRTDHNYLLTDFDDSDLTPEQAIAVLSTIDPQIKDSSLCIIPSSSSYLYTSEGLALKEGGNFHIYFEVVGNPVVYGTALFNKLLLSGHCKPHITSAGTIVIRSIFDRSILSPEREIFCSQPVLESGLVSKRSEHILYQEGDPIDCSTLKSLSREEELGLRQLFIDTRNSVADKAYEIRQEYNDKRAKRRAKANGTSKFYELAAINDQVTVYDKNARPIIELLSNEVILDSKGEEFFVRDIMIDPPEEPVKIPDPHEPYKRGSIELNQVGSGVATILSHSMIYSHAHSGIIYSLRWSPNDLIATLQSDAVSVNAKKLIYRLISTNQQEIASTATDSDLGEIADAFKKALANVTGSGVGTEKAAIKKKLQAAKEPESTEDELELGLNSRYGVAMLSGKTVVLCEEWLPSINSFETVISKPVEHEQFFRNKQIKVPNQNVYKSAFSVWMDSPSRNTYDSVYFEPNRDLIRKPGQTRIIQQGGVYNLWSGYVADLSKAKHPTLILEHLKDVWCSGIEEEWNYLQGWLGTLFQKPASLNGTSLVLQSTPGAGKNIIIDNCIVPAFGIHGMSTTRRDDIVGRFNKQLSLNVFLFANEATFAGVHEDKQTIKTLITDPYRTVEMKGLDSFKSRNYTNVIFGSNDGWVINLDAGDRRFCYLSVNDSKAKDSKYFKALMEEIENGGKEGFLDYFLNLPIFTFDASDIPQGNITQRISDLIRSSHPTTRFFLILLDTEGSLEIFFDVEKVKTLAEWWGGNGPMEISREGFYKFYNRYAEYYNLNRGYDDIITMQREMETSGYLAPTNCSDPSKYPIVRKMQRGIPMWEFKQIDVCRELAFKGLYVKKKPKVEESECEFF